MIGWKIEKLELKIGVFDQNESERNLAKEKVRFRSGVQTIEKRWKKERMIRSMKMFDSNH